MRAAQGRGVGGGAGDGAGHRCGGGRWRGRRLRTRIRGSAVPLRDEGGFEAGEVGECLPIVRMFVAGRAVELFKNRDDARHQRLGLAEAVRGLEQLVARGC